MALDNGAVYLGALLRYHGFVEDQAEMNMDWSQCAVVESVPGKMSGAWVFRGTRIPVAAIFENLEDGLTIGEVTALFDGLTREQVKAVLEFAAQSLESPSLSR